MFNVLFSSWCTEGTQYINMPFSHFSPLEYCNYSTVYFPSHHQRKTRPRRNLRQRHCYPAKSSSQRHEQWLPAAKSHPSRNAHLKTAWGTATSSVLEMLSAYPHRPQQSLLNIFWLVNQEEPESYSHLLKIKPPITPKSLTVHFTLFIKHNRGWFKLLSRSAGSYECRY